MLSELVQQQRRTDADQHAQHQHPREEPGLYFHVVEDAAEIDGILLRVRLVQHELNLCVLFGQHIVVQVDFLLIPPESFG